MGTCDRHGEVTEKLENHEGRIQKLEISDATMGQKIENLTGQIENLVGWLKALVFSILATGCGFIIWYIQNIL